jgi:YegS/Rv2252/BmrU family lipid kinase
VNTYCFIVNPAAGKGKAAKAVATLKQEIYRRSLSAEICLTERRGHARLLAERTQSPVVVAVGGDGTVNEIVNGITGTEKTLGIIPAGSGNDLVKSLDIPTDLSAALDAVQSSRGRLIDAAVVRCSSQEPEVVAGNSDRRYFVNGVGIGFDAAVAERTMSIKYLSGFALYLSAVFQTLGTYTAPNFRIWLDGEVTEGKHLLIAIGNGRCAGGGFYLTPNAAIDDGSLDVCLIEDRSVPSILRLMPRVMKGKHHESWGVRLTRAENIRVEADEPFYVHADGEVVGREVNNVEVSIHKQVLKVIVGEKFKQRT